MTTAAGSGVLAAPAAPAARVAREGGDRLLLALMLAFGVALLLCIFVPMGVLLQRSVMDSRDGFVGLANYQKYFASGAFLTSLGHSLWVALATSLLVITLAFGYAWALCRSCMPGRGFFRAMVYVPLLIPGILKAIALIYLFGNQGWLKSWLFGGSIYGPLGVVSASVMWTFPHAVLIIVVSLAHADRRLYQAAQVLQASGWRTFWHVTWPACRYGVVTAFLSVFVMVFTDFGIAKVIGGSYNLLATDIYKEVVGLQNFETGAVVSVVLLLPAVLVFALERHVAGKQSQRLSGRSLPLQVRPSAVRDRACFAYCALVVGAIAVVLAMAQFAALVKFWPYNLSLTWANYQFDMEGVGWENFWNSLRLSGWVATLGAALIFIGAYVVEKPRLDAPLRRVLQMAMLLPMAIPGLVLGLAYLMFINRPGNPVGALYGTMALLVVSTLTHLYSVPHLSALTALKSLDPEIERVGLALNAPVWRVFWKVTLPACAGALLDIWLYLFLRSMTTLSALIFLYTAQTKVAAVAVIHIDETGSTASAAAMAMLIVYACLAVRVVHHVVSERLLVKLQRWRQPQAV
ncbi:MAG: putative 2-aminoethylphosphonate ABC transporter permease subunit [Lautropia sp.]